ncbi:PadR family transcriptional regulator [Nocardioides sp.]|uniref:PadR family transcriptional regulator n=1 Tax=Nocardioides sp. TaxID=35761 RepID=UPI003D0C2A20
MALEHALLVSLSERPAAGLELTRRFERSIGFFWAATHQQIYRTLARMEADGWVSSTVVSQQGRPDKKVYAVSPQGQDVLAAWLTTPSPQPNPRSDLSVKMRGASFAADRDAVLDVVRADLAEHRTRLAYYQQLEKRDYPTPGTLNGLELDQHLVLRGGIRLEEFWVSWLEEYLHAHERPTS